MEILALKKISPADISREFPYACRRRLEDPALRASISKYGILEPLLVTAAPARTLVAGHRRFQAALHLKLTEIPVREIPARYCPEDLFFLFLAANLNHVWSDLDRALCLHRAAAIFHFPEKVILEEVLPCLGLPSQKGICEEAVTVAGLDPALLDAIAAGEMPYRGAKALALLKKPDQAAWADLIRPQTSLTTNQLLKTAEWLKDLLALCGQSLERYLADSGLDRVLDHPSSDRRRKAELFYAAIRALRFPRLAEREEKFKAASREISGEAAKELVLEAPPDFEGQGVTLRTRMKTPESVDKVLEILASKRSKLKSLFDIVL